MDLNILMDVSVSNLNWVEIAIWMICLSPIWGVILWSVWEGSVRPALIPRDEIQTEVEKLMAQKDGRGFEAACTEEHAAWYRSNCFEQGRWRRVRKEIMRRERKHGAIFRRVLR